MPTKATRRPGALSAARDQAAAPKDKSAEKGTRLRIPKDCKPEVHKAIDRFRGHHEQAKEQTEKKAKLKEALEPLALRLLCRVWSEMGKRPPAPYLLVNKIDQRLTYVLRDKTAKAEISAEQVTDLAGVLGKAKVGS